MVNVLVVNSIDALSGGVNKILKREADFLTTTKEVTDQSSFERTLDEVQPDVVILTESMFYTLPDALLRWNLSYPKTRVIVLDEKQNLIHILENREIVLKHAVDLVDIIRDNLSQAC